MNFGVVGLSFQDTPLEIMNRTALSDTQKMELCGRFAEEIPAHGVFLSTCNRTEFYFSVGDEDLLPRVKSFFLSLFPGLTLEDYLFFHTGKEALRHLFQVTAGLCSVVLGEDQILGQVKDAHQLAMSLGCCDKALNKIFLAAVTTAKELKSSLGISEIPLSLSYIGIKLLLETCGIAGKTAVVLGAGKMGSLAVRYLLENKIGQVIICSRSGRPIPDVRHGCELIYREFGERYEAIRGADLVISATAAPHLVLEKEKMADCNRPLTILDLAMPLDAEPSLRELPGVTLFNMDDLREISERNKGERLRLSEKAEVQIEQDVEELLNQLELLKADRVIRHLNSRCDAVAEDTMNFIRSKLPLSEREETVISRAVRSSLRKMIQEPVHTMKDLRGGEIGACIEAAEQLYGLKDSAEKEAGTWN